MKNQIEIPFLSNTYGSFYVLLCNSQYYFISESYDTDLTNLLNWTPCTERFYNACLHELTFQNNG